MHGGGISDKLTAKRGGVGMELAGVILTGGKSSRMGRDKCTLELEGQTFLQRLVERYRPCMSRLFVSVDRPGRFDTAGAEEICDLRAGNQGPLAGLEAALAQTRENLIFLTAVDLPFGDPALTERLMELRGSADICCIRRAGGQLEPLFALYSADCLPAVSACLDEGRRSLHSLMQRVDTRLVNEEELVGFDLNRILMNVNRPEDFERARLAVRR